MKSGSFGLTAPRLGSLLAGALLGLLTLQAAFYGGMVVQRARSDRNTLYPEWFLAERARAVALGQPLFPPNPATWPHQVAAYGPLTFATVGWVVRWTGLPSDRSKQLVRFYHTGRLFSLIGLVASLAALASLAGAFGLVGWERLLPVLLFFSAPAPLRFAYTYRADMIVLALVLWAWRAALSAVASRDRSLSRRASGMALGAAGLMVVAILFKQPAAFSAVVCAAWLLTRNPKRTFLEYCLAGTALGVAVGGSLCFMTQGLWWTHNLTALTAPLLPRLAYAHLWHHFWLARDGLLNGLPLVGGVAALGALAAARWKGCAQGVGMGAWAFVFSLAVAECGAMRSGSDINYYLEPYAWGTLLTAWAGAHLARTIRSATSWSPGSVTAAILLTALASHYAYHDRVLIMRRDDLLAVPRVKTEAEALRRLHSISGEVFFENGELWWWTEAAPTLTDPAFYYMQVLAGKWSREELLRKVEREGFRYVVLNNDVNRPRGLTYGFPFLGQDLLSAVQCHYVLDWRLDGIWVYRPSQ